MLYAIFCIFLPFLSDPIACDAALSNRWLNLALLLLAALAAVYYAALSAPGAARPTLEAAEIAAKAAAAAAEKAAAEAAKAVATTLAWRKSNRMDELSAELKELERPLLPLEEHRFIRKGFETYIAPGGMRFVHPNPTRGPILIASMVQFDYNAAMRKLTRAEYTNINLAMNEWNAMQCDVVTRATGRLTKAARLVSCKGFRVGSLNRQWLKLDGDVAKEMQDCYPQLLGVIICLDPPQWALVMWRAVKILFPPRMVEKVDLLSTKDRALKPRLQRYMDVRDMERILSSPPLA